MNLFRIVGVSLLIWLSYWEIEREKMACNGGLGDRLPHDGEEIADVRIVEGTFQDKRIYFVDWQDNDGLWYRPLFDGYDIHTPSRAYRKINEAEKYKAELLARRNHKDVENETVEK